MNISSNTLDQWLKRREEKGSLAPQEYRRRPKPKINDLEAFKAFAEAHGHLTQKEMAEKWDKPVSSVLIRQRPKYKLLAELLSIASKDYASYLTIKDDNASMISSISEVIEKTWFKPKKSTSS